MYCDLLKRIIVAAVHACVALAPAVPTVLHAQIRVSKDSSGIRVVDLPSVTGIESEWRLRKTPEFRVGWASTDPPLENVISARVLNSGRVVVADAGANTLYILDSRGAVAAVLGRKGKGPGEFMGIIGVTPLGADSFLVMDYANARASTYNGDRLVSDTRLRISPPYVYDTHSQFPEDRFLVTPFAGVFPNPGWGTAPVMRADVTFSKADTIMQRDVLLAERRFNRNPVKHRGWLECSGNMIITARTDRPQVEWRTLDGVLIQVSRWPDRNRSLNEDDWDRYAAAVRKRAGTNQRAQAESALAAGKAHFGGKYPSFRSIHAGHQGDVWIAQFDLASRSQRSGRYWVLSRDFGWKAFIELAPQSEILDIGRDRLLVLEYDEFDVQAVAVYQIDRSR